MIKQDQISNLSSKSITFLEAQQPVDFTNVNLVNVEELTSDIVLQTPTNVDNDIEISYIFKQDSIGGHSITFFTGETIEGGLAGQSIIVKYHHLNGVFTRFFSNWTGLNEIIQEQLTNGSNSTFVETTKRIVDTATTETITLSELSNGGQATFIPPETGIGVKTVENISTGISGIFSKSKLGYIRLTGNNTTALQLGNGDIIINPNDTIVMTIRIPNSQLTGFVGEIDLFKSNQDDGNGNVLYRLGIGGGSSNNPLTRNRIFISRAANTASPNIVTEYIPEENAWGNTPFIGLVNPVLGISDTWIHIFAHGKDISSETTNVRTALYNGGSNSFQKNNSQNLLAAIHEFSYTTGGLFWRRTGDFEYDINSIGSGIIPNLNNLDFRISPSSGSNNLTLDIARISKLKNLDNNDLISLANGVHPLQLKENLDVDEFVNDFDSLPSNMSVLGGNPIFTPVNDGPICEKYHNDTSETRTLNINNQIITNA